jgi:hypothetical protein
MKKPSYFELILSGLFICFVLWGCENAPAAKSSESIKAPIPADADKIKKSDSLVVEDNIIDEEAYNKRMLALAHDSITKRWPVKSPVPLSGAILPFQRVVAYYGNFYSRHMGILGSLPEDKLISNLTVEVENWNKADKNTPVLPAIHYIAITAQSKPGKGNTYRLRMPEKQILKAVDLAKKIKGITFLDIQVGHSTVSKEVPTLEKYLMNPDVHLGLDPEWSMKDGSIPGRKIGTMDAADINFAVDYLSALVKKHQLPPKILVVHRFTKGMITNSDKIKRTPEVQLVINMDGFGFPAKKIDSYRRFVSGYPVQFTGFKLFYKNDTKSAPYRMMSPNEILKLYPKPIYIQYQ